MTNGLTLPNTAIPTWSGFVYQGKIAIYHVLKILCESHLPTVLGYSLQLDSIEDFTIISKQSDGSLLPITMHQVKALNNFYYSTYQDDFIKLTRKKADYGTAATVAYFHLAVQNERTATQIEQVHPNLKIYTYGTVEFCPLGEIDRKIRQWISQFLQAQGVPGHNNESRIAILATLIEGLISKVVVAIHYKNHLGTPAAQAAYNTLTELSEIYQILITDPAAAIIDEHYLEIQIKTSLNRYYSEFCNDPANHITTPDIKDKLERYMVIINSYSSKDFHHFLQSVQPHRIVNYSNIQETFDSIIQQEAFKDDFLHILKSIRDCDDLQNFLWQCPNKQFYLPTSIPTSNDSTEQKKVCERIVKTILSTNVNAPFNADYLISNRCNAGDILSSANPIYNVFEGDEKITTWKKIKLIDLETAKTILNA